MNLKANLENNRKNLILIFSILSSVFAFLVFYKVASHKMAHASLGINEAAQYWYSKLMFGKLPVEQGDFSRLKRIVDNNHPPFFNFLMFIWLKFGSSDRWFRLFGVLMGLFSMGGIFASIKRVTKNTLVAAWTVFVCAFIYQLAYIWQDETGMNLAIALLSWCVYLWICNMEKASVATIFLFAGVSTLAILTRYGCSFVVAGMALCLALHWKQRKKKKELLLLAFGGGAGGMLIFLNLLLFGFRQLFKQFGVIRGQSIEYEYNIITGVVRYFYQTFKWIFFNDGWGLFVFLSLILLAATGVVAVMEGAELYRWILICDVVVWLLFYIFTRSGVYGAGNFRNENSLMLFPLWVVTIVILLEHFRVYLDGFELCVKYEVTRYCLCFVGVFCLLFCWSSWKSKLEDNWSKDSSRELVRAWDQENVDASDTIVYYATKWCFSRYAYIDAQVTDQEREHVFYMGWLKEKEEAEYLEYFDSFYQDNYPEKLYFAANNIKSDMNTISKVFEDKGYKKELVYSQDGAKLFLFTKAGVEASAEGDALEAELIEDEMTETAE